MLARDFSELGTQVNVMPEIINARDQAFQNERGFIAGHDKLTGVIRQTTALKERKRHFGRMYFGGMPGLYPSCAASVTLLLAPSKQAKALFADVCSYLHIVRCTANAPFACKPYT